MQRNSASVNNSIGTRVRRLPTTRPKPRLKNSTSLSDPYWHTREMLVKISYLAQATMYVEDWLRSTSRTNFDKLKITLENADNN